MVGTPNSSEFILLPVKFDFNWELPLDRGESVSRYFVRRGRFRASSDGVAKKAEAILAQSVQARQLFDESESIREWVLHKDRQDLLEESDDCAELIS